ncbi:formylglycine-generating enzyme family protein [Fusobacterium pseudoperiodonticum]
MALKKAILDINKIEKIELDLAKLEKIELDLDSIEKIVQSLKDDIKKITVGEKPAELKPTFEDMIFVKGGKYQPSFTDEEKEVSNLEVSKYLITQKLWQELIRNNPANFKGDENRPIEYISWWHALEFCNRLSEKYGLRPVYNLGKSDQGLLMINQLDGTVVSPDVADFNKTEGFRLPTEVEWEWFARGGQVALDNGTFDYTYSGSNNIDDVAWYTGNSKDTTQSVGLKMPNVLGLYDCNGNVWEWCYDTTEGIESGKSYVYKAYDHSNVYRRLKGGSWCNNTEVCAVAVRGNSQATYAYSNAGFRIVRTVL